MPSKIRKQFGIFTAFAKLCLLSLLLLPLGCERNTGSNKESAAASRPAQTKSDTPPYVSTGDLDAIKQRGVLRILAPQFDQADSLPRDGRPVLDYQSLAEQFAQEHGLQAEMVYVDGFDDLITALVAGKGDVIATNLTQTQSRGKLVAFTRAITHIDEWVVAPKAQAIHGLKDIPKISVPQGTAYPETLAEKHFSGNVELLPSSTGNDDVLQGIEEGKYVASVFDSNVARALLDDYPKLAKKLTIDRNRSIAWATRKDNPVLLSQLNKFLVSHFVSKSPNKPAKLDWKGIKARGTLRMLTLNNPASYFMYRGELMGFDYELVKKFADDNNLHLAIVIKDSIPQLIDALHKGEGDVIAASLTESDKRKAMGLHFTRPYMVVSEQVVGRKDGPKIGSLDELDGFKVGVNPATVFYAPLRKLAQRKHNVTLLKFPDESTENLITRMTEGEFDFTVADSHLVAMEMTYRDNIAVMFDIKKSNLVWMLRDNQPVLEKKLDGFIEKVYRGLFYNVVWNKYFKNSKKIQRYQAGRVLPGGALSPYDDVVKREAAKYHMDWRLVVSQMYQESKFNPDVRSFAGARGLMQVLPRTAKEFGYTNLRVPKNGIAAGVAYMHWLSDRFSGEINLDQRIYFTLAAYNAGTGHVRDARKLAARLGLNPNAWFNNVAKAMLLLSKPKYYKKASFGYVRGSEPVDYVRSIRERYLSYLKL